MLSKEGWRGPSVWWRWSWEVKEAERKRECWNSYLKSQDHTEVILFGIAASCVVTVVDKDIWELCCDSHAVTIQWVQVVVDPLLPI